MIDEKKIEEAARTYILSKHAKEAAYFQLRSIEDFKEGAHWAIQEMLPMIKKSLEQAYRIRGEYLSQGKYAKIASPLLDLLRLEDITPKQEGDLK